MQVRLIAALVAAAMSFVAAPQVGAADYPERPVTFVIPFGPGGASDLFARLLAASAPKYLSQPVVAVNRAGAAGVVGSTFVVKSEADGYTMLAARVGPQMSAPALNKTIAYKWDEFTFVGLAATSPFVLVVPGDSEFKTFADFEKKLKAGADLSYASVGVGGLLHVASLIMASEMGVDPAGLIHVPFQGGGKAQTAVISGTADFMWQNLSGVRAAIEAGQLRALAITTPERFKALPDIPTVAELGYPNMEAVVGWDAIYGPPGLPQNVVDTWIEVLNKLGKDEEWLEKMAKLGNIVDIRSPEETKAFVQKQYEAFDKTIDKLGMRITK